MGSNTKIAIIDSGIVQHPLIKPPTLEVTINAEKDGNILIEQGAVDFLGHGTAVYYSISSVCIDAEFYIVKVFEKSMNVDEITLIAALQYCVEELHPDIIHMSNGITYCENLTILKALCDKAKEMDIIIIAAFDNFGTYSYPAAFENVIGVDVSTTLKKGYIFSERKDINIIVPNMSRKVPWINDGYFVCNGTSFNACFVTIMVAQAMKNTGTRFDDIMKELKGHANNIIEAPSEYETEKCPEIKKAAVFPFNKEIHSLIRFQEQLPFNINIIYDIKYNRNIGKFPEDILEIKNKTKALKIESIDNVNWESDFDTFILGHIKEIESTTQKKYSKYIVENCLKYSKSLYSLSDIEDSEMIKNKFIKKGLHFYIPRVRKENIPNLYNGKLRCIGIPILGIFGTSSRQGKFTLQVRLRNYFINKGLKIGQLGTEPTSPLFGFDETYPMGYESTVEVSGVDSIAVLNQMMSNIEDKNPDIILVGSQSQTIPQQTGNLSLYVLQQHEFILATEPDAVILCVNIFDEDNYIKRTIDYIESIVNAQVIALVLFPKIREIKSGVMTNKLLPATNQQIANAKERLKEHHQRSVFVAEEELKELGNLCIQYFSDKELAYEKEY